MSSVPREDLPLSVQTVIRPELNLEKWPLWIPAHSGTGERVRLLQQQEGSLYLTCGTGRDGQPLSLLTTEDQKLYYGLVRLWEEAGRPENEMVLFSLNQLARTVRKSWSIKTYTSLRAGLERLIKTGLEWTDAYVGTEKTGAGRKAETMIKSTSFQILSEKTLIEVVRDGRVTKAACQFQFHPRIRQNLLLNHTRPVLLDVVLGFHSELAQLLYTRLDLCLYREKTPSSGDYVRTTEGLFHDLSLNQPEYRKVSARIRRLRPALEELLGKPYATGVIEAAFLEPTADGNDYKATFRKRAARKVIREPQSSPATSPTSLFEDTEEELPEKDASGQLVRTFHKLRYGQEQEPTEKERLEAKRLLGEGEAWAHHLIAFAAKKGKEDNGFPNDFGGVSKLASQAKVGFEEKQTKQRQVQRQNARQRHQNDHTAAYSAFLVSLLAEGEESPFRGAMEPFREQEMRTYQFHQRRAEKSPGSARIIEGYFEQENRVSRLRQYIEENRKSGLPTFWQWDAQFNPTPFSSSENSP